VAAREGGLAADAAVEYVKDLKRSRRYVEDVY
jgi:sulfite reductase alpha subunit-like flavoprotein